MLNWGSQRKVLVLCYHNVGPRFGQRLETWALTVTSKQFRTHLSIFSKTLDLITPTDWDQAVAGRITLPPRPTLITFDDGTSGLLQNALPILKEFKVQSVCFTSIQHHEEPRMPYWWDLADQAYGNDPDFEKKIHGLRFEPALETARKLSQHAKNIPDHLMPMSCDELKKWCESGQYLASHGNHHDAAQTWTTSSDLDPSGLKTIADAQFWNTLALPYGEIPTSDRMDFLNTQLKSNGFQAAFTTHSGLFKLPKPGTSIPLLNRQLVPSQWSTPRLLSKILRIALDSKQ